MHVRNLKSIIVIVALLAVGVSGNDLVKYQAAVDSKFSGTPAAGQYLMEIPLAPICLNGAFHISVSNLTGSVEGTLTISTDAKGSVSGQLEIGGQTLAVTGKFKSTASLQSLSLSASSNTDKLTLRGTLHGTLFTGTTSGKGLIAPGRGTFTLDVSTASPMVASVNLTLTNGLKGAISGFGTATVCDISLPITATGKVGSKSNLNLKGTSFSFSGKGHQDLGKDFLWKATGFGAKASGTNLLFEIEAPYFTCDAEISRPPQGPMEVTIPDGNVIQDGTDQLLVFLDSAATTDDMMAIASILSDANASVVGEIPSIHELQIEMQDVNQLSNLITLLEASPGVLYAGPNLFVQYDTCSGTGVQGVNWAAADNLLVYPTKASNVVIGILDCFSEPMPGSKKSHGEVVEAFLKDSVGSALSSQVKRVASTCGLDAHGILTAAANFVLANPGKKVVLNASIGSGSSAPFAAEIFWYKHFKFLAQALKQQFGDRVIFVKSAGNQGFTDDIPADPNVVGCNFVKVGGLDHSSPTEASKSYNSNKGPGISVFAPSCGVTPDTHFSSEMYDGTSFAAPQVAGQLAALLAKYPSLSGCDVADQLANLPEVNGFRRFDGKQLDTLVLDVAMADCNYAISPSTKSFSENSGSGSVTVTTSKGCPWTATSNDGWITVTSIKSGNGNGTVGYSVTANNGTDGRTGTITIAGKTFTVQQGAGVVLMDDTMTSALPPFTCPTAPASAYTFVKSDAQANVWVDIDNVAPGDVIQWIWRKPNGQVYLKDTTNISVTGEYCFWDTMYISGYVPSSTPGNWTVSVVYNGIVLVTEGFLIFSGQCTGMDDYLACVPCNTDADCGLNYCWHNNPPAPFCP